MSMEALAPITNGDFFVQRSQWVNLHRGMMEERFVQPNLPQSRRSKVAQFCASIMNQHRDRLIPNSRLIALEDGTKVVVAASTSVFIGANGEHIESVAVSDHHPTLIVQADYEDGKILQLRMDQFAVGDAMAATKVVEGHYDSSGKLAYKEIFARDTDFAAMLLELNNLYFNEGARNITHGELSAFNQLMQQVRPVVNQ